MMTKKLGAVAVLVVAHARMMIQPFEVVAA
jgi:hypothetical protein